MPDFDPDSLIGKTFLLPPEKNGERLRAKVTKKVAEEIESEDGNRIPNINYILDIGQGVGSTNVPFLMCTLETLQKNIAAQVLYS